MRSDREAKKILRAFGKEAYKERVRYVDSFMPEKVPFMRSISYRHAFRKAVTIALLAILIMALAVSAYAAVMHYLNYTKIVHSDNDEYISNTDFNAETEENFFIPTYVPSEYKLVNEYFDDTGDQIIYVYEDEKSDSLIIRQCLKRDSFHIDNERSECKTIMIENLEVIIYDFSDEILAIMQYDNNWITIAGKVDETELEKIIRGMDIPD